MVNLVPIGWKNGQPQRLSSGDKLDRAYLDLPDAGQALTFMHKLTGAGTWTHDLESLSGKIAKLTVDASGVGDGVTVKVDGSTIDTLTPGQKDWYFVEPTTSVAVEADGFVGFDLSAAAYDNQSYNFSAQLSSSEDVRFSPDGTKFYLMRLSTPATIWQYSLSTPWVLNSGVSYVGSLIIFSVVTTNPLGLHLSDDGTKLYVVAHPSSTPTVHQWNLSVPHDITSAAYFNSITLSLGSTAPANIYLTPELDKMLITATNYPSPANIHQFSLTSGNITTATADGVTLDVFPQTGYTAKGLAWSAARDKVFIISSVNRQIYQYDCPTPGTLDGATFDSSFDLSPEGSSPSGLAFTPDGYRFFTTVGNTVRRYKSGQGFSGTARVHLSYQL